MQTTFSEADEQDEEFTALLADCERRQATEHEPKAPAVNTAYVRENAEGTGDDEVYTPRHPK